MPRNLKRNTGESTRKNRPVSFWMDKEKKKIKKILATTAKKLKTAPDIQTPELQKAAKKFQAAEVKATNDYLKDMEKSIKAHKSGTQRGKAYASQHKTRAELMGRKLDKLKTVLGKKANKKKKDDY